jgi:GPH family glycoside/pentoside/hexuronide:cation symporter
MWRRVKKRVLTKGQKVAYGLTRFGPSTMLDITTLAGVLLYYGFGLLPGFLSALPIALSYLISAAGDSGFGYLSDRTPTKRWGRRRPYMIIGAPFMALSFAMYFLPTLFVSASDVIGLFIWATVWICMFKMFYSFTMTPFQCWMPEITEPEERASVSAWQNGANFAASTLGIFGSILLPLILPAGFISTPLLILILVIVLIELIGFIPPLLKIKGEGKFLKQPAFRRDYGFALRNRNYVLWIIVQGILSFAFVMIETIAMTYLTGSKSVLHFNFFPQMVIFGVEMLVIIYSFFVIWPALIRRRGKRYTLTISLLITMIACPFIFFVGQVPGFPLSADLQAYIVIGLILTGLAGYFLMPYIIYADFAHVDQIRTGEGRAGVYTGFSSIPLNIFQFFSTLLLGFLLGLPNAPGQTFSIGLLLWGPISAVFLLLGLLVLRKTNIDPDFAALEKEHGKKAKKE